LYTTIGIFPNAVKKSKRKEYGKSVTMQISVNLNPKVRIKVNERMIKLVGKFIYLLATSHYSPG
jgi:hypothetical protein